MALAHGITVRLLGPIDAVGPRGEVELGGPRQRRLLAALALRVGRPVDIGELVDVVWADGGLPADPRETLRTYVSRLRRALGDPGLVLSRTRAYQLDLGAEDIDAAAFEALLAPSGEGDAASRLHRAIACWRGPALAGFEHEDWARPHVARLHELRLHAVDELADALLAGDRHDEAVALLEGAAADQPLRERTHRLLMLALHRAGRTAESLRVFQAYRHRLATDLGLGPGDEIVALERRIVAGDHPDGAGALAGYQVHERIGWGAFAEVYRAVQPSLGRDVAVKKIRAELANRPDFVRRFEAEARVVARLEHPNIVPLYDYWREPGSAYLVMRWMRGGSLAERLSRGPLPLADVVAVVRDIGAALVAAHRAGILHRDVKPANILLDDGGHLYLADFGIAHDVQDAVSPSSRGSPPFAPPEQRRGERVGPPADVYGLASVVRAALPAGPRPEGDRIGAVLARATAERPGDRHASIAEFVADFLAAADHDPASADGSEPLRSSGVNPYKGLRAFDEADRADFFGREDLVASLVDRLDVGARFLAVVGPSGSGKSSLVRAGLVPALRRPSPTGQDWLIATMVPGIDPYRELASALRSVATTDQSDLLAALGADVDGVAHALDAMGCGAAGPLLLVIDQFEELYTLATDGPRRDRFVDALAHALAASDGGLRLVITLRADFYDRPLHHPALAALVSDATVVVPPLAPDELERAIVAPARRERHTFEPGLVASLIADVGAQAAALPLLQYALTELFERSADGVLRVADYQDIGGIAGAIAAQADALLPDDDGPTTDAARRLMLRLVTLGEGAEDMRRRVRRSELGDDPEGAAVLDAFGAARLLSFDRDPVTREPTVEVAHEALIRQWPRLRRWLVDDRASLRVHRQLTVAANAWDDGGRDDEDLLRPARLVELDEWEPDHRQEMNEVERTFVAASRLARDAERQREDDRRRYLARQNRRLRRLAVATVSIAVLALLAGGIALQQRGTARTKASLATRAAFDTETSRLAADAAQVVTVNRRVGLLLAAEAYRRQPSPATLAALHRVLVRADGLLRFLGAPSPYVAAAWLDPHHLAIGRVGAVEVYRDDGHLDRTLNGVTADRLVADTASSTLAAATNQGLRLTNLDGPAGWGPPILPNESIQAMAFAADGLLLVGTRSGLLVGVDATTGGERFRSTAHPEVTVDQLPPIGLRTEPLPHVPASAAHGVMAIAVDRPSGLVLTTGFGYARVWRLARGAAGLAEVSQSLLVAEVDGTRMAATGVVAGFVGEGPSPRATVADARQTWTIRPDDGSIDTSAPARDRFSFLTTSEVAPLAFDRRGRLVGGFGGGFITVDDPAAVAPTVQILHGVGVPSSIALAADGDRLLVVGSGGAVLLSLRGDGPTSRVLDGTGLGEVAVSDDGAYVAVSDATTFDARLWHLTADGVPELVDLGELHPFYMWMGPGGRVAAADRRRGVALLDGATGRTLAMLEGWSGVDGTYPTFSADGRLLAVSTQGGEVAVFSADDGQRQWTFTDLATASDRATDAPFLAFGPGGTQLTGVWPGHPAVRWDLSNGVPTVLGDLGADLTAFTIGPAGELVSGHSSGQVVVRDPTTLQPTGTTFDATRGGYASVTYSADGRRLLTAFSGESRLWDATSHQPIGDALPSDENSVLYPSTSLTYAVTVLDRRLVRWSIDDRQWPAIACAVAGRDLTPSEWAQYGPRDSPYHSTCSPPS